MINIDRAFEYACNKYYYVIYDRDRCGYEQRVDGILLNYTGSNIVLLSEKGMYHIKYKDIIFMKPIEPRMDKLNKEFKVLLESFNNNDPVVTAIHDWTEAYIKGAESFMEYIMAYARSGKSLYESEMKDVFIEFCKQLGELNEISS